MPMSTNHSAATAVNDCGSKPREEKPGNMLLNFPRYALIPLSLLLATLFIGGAAWAASVTTDYEHNDRGLEIRRIEAVGTPSIACRWNAGPWTRRACWCTSRR